MKDLEALTDKEFAHLPHRTQARVMRKYGRTVGIDMSERQSRQLATRYNRLREATPVRQAEEKEAV